jgi:pyruvate/2-oxoglutarate dehydrogenase complex dihydrolipoamide dehydrogenase (E3) component
LTYNDIRGLTALPPRVAVVGGADTGCQMASIFADFGVNVLLLETAPVIVPAADASVSEGLQKAFEARGMDVLTSAQVEALERNGGEVSISISRGGSIQRLQVDAVFAAVGWPARLEELRPGAAGLFG